MSAVAALAVASPAAVVAISELSASIDPQPQHREFVQAAGVTDTMAQWIGCLVKPDQGTYRCTPAIIDGTKIFTWLFFVGCVFALVWTALSVFIALLYNLISDIVGGVEVTLSERHRG